MPNLTWLLDLSLLTIGLSCLFGFLMGTRPLFVPDEGRYAEIAREMFASHNYITPYLNYVPYFEKPPLFYWLASLAFKLGGTSVVAIRSVNVILGIFGCLANYIIGRLMYDRIVGWTASLLLGTSWLYFVMSQMVSLDLPVSILITASLYCFLIATQSKTVSVAKFLMMLASITSACAVLTKGLIGIVFPAMVISLWLLLTRKWQLIKIICAPLNLLIFLSIVLPWHVLMEIKNPGFSHFYFIEQHLLRYTTKDIGHYQSIWYFIPVLLIGFLPWTFFLPQTLYQACKNAYKGKQNELYLLVWFFIIFAFFSFSKSKLIPYILPVFPPLAFLSAIYLRDSFKKNVALNLKVGFIIYALFCMSIPFISYQFAVATPVYDQTLVFKTLFITGSILSVGTLASLVLLFLNRLKWSLAITLISSIGFLVTGILAVPSFETRTILPLVQVLTPLLKPYDHIVTYNQYYQDLPFYLKRRIEILNWRNELTDGMRYIDTAAWMIDDEGLRSRWASNQRTFVVLPNNEVSSFHYRPLYVLASTPTTSLISNQK